MIDKITVGYVVQTFSDDGKPVSQEFIAGDVVTNPQYFPFEMVQPNVSNEPKVPNKLINACRDIVETMGHFGGVSSDSFNKNRPCESRIVNLFKNIEQALKNYDARNAQEDTQESKQ